MFYIIYKTTNSINGKIYIGLHKTVNLNDGYQGSGKALLRAIKKYGKENFNTEILEHCSTEAEMIEREKDIVNEAFCADQNTYNLMPGGRFGSNEKNGLSFSGRHHTDETKRKMSESLKGRKVSPEARKKMSENNFARRDPERQRLHASMLGSRTSIKRKQSNYIHSEETKKKVSESLINTNTKRKQNGMQHPNTGMKRISIQCPFCDKIGASNVMSRFHFENCKNNPLA